MKNIITLFKKELASYFNSPIAYIFTAIFLIVGNWLFFQNFFLIKQASMRNYFALLPWIFLFLAPVITMRIWSEEKRSGTIEVLLTLPFKDWEVVLAKFFSALSFLMIVVLLSLSIPITLARLGNVDLGPIIGGYLGAFLMGAAYIAIGIFISSLTKNQIIAFLIAIAVCFTVFIVGYPFVVDKMGSLAPLFKYLGLGSHFNNIGRGVIDTRDIVYYVSIIFLFLWLNVRSVESRNWK
jgi:ABC-2 type transport system permease protein